MKGWLMMSRVRGCVYNRLLVGSCAACGELRAVGSSRRRPAWPRLREKREAKISRQNALGRSLLLRAGAGAMGDPQGRVIDFG